MIHHSTRIFRRDDEGVSHMAVRIGKKNLEKSGEGLRVVLHSTIPIQELPSRNQAMNNSSIDD